VGSVRVAIAARRRGGRRGGGRGGRRGGPLLQ
jgi:hypothetical protein